MTHHIHTHTETKTTTIPSTGARMASAYGAEDGLCHWFVTAGRTLCGQHREPPLRRRQLHHEPPCPNGNDPCPECLGLYNESEE